MTSTGLPAIPAYLTYSANETRYVTRYESSDAQTKADIAYLRKQAPKLTSPAALLKDYRSLSVVLEAFGMKDQVSATALLRQLMTQNPTDPKSLAQKSQNPIFMRFAKAMSNWTTSPFGSSTAVNAIVTAFATNRFEASADAQTPGVGTALYFARTAGQITNINQLMSDTKLLSVVETVNNLPTAFGGLDYTAQFARLSKLVNVKNFQDPAYVRKLAEQYIVMTQENNDQSGGATGIVAAFNAGGAINAGQSILGTLFPSSSGASGNPILSLFA